MSGIGHLHAAIGQRRFFPILDGMFTRRQGLLERGRTDRNFPAAAVKQKEPGSLARRHRQGFELDLLAVRRPGHLQRTGHNFVIVDNHALALEAASQDRVHDQLGRERARFPAQVGHANQDQIIARQVGQRGLVRWSGDGECLFHNPQITRRKPGADNGDARRHKLLFLPDHV